MYLNVVIMYSYFTHLFLLSICHGLGELGAHVSTDIRRQTSFSFFEVVEDVVDSAHLVATQLALKTRHFERLKAGGMTTYDVIKRTSEKYCSILQGIPVW